MKSRLPLALALLVLAGCSSVTQISWGDAAGNNYYAAFVRDRPWSPPVFVSRGIDRHGRDFQPSMLAAATGDVVGIGGEFAQDAQDSAGLFLVK